MSTSIRGHLLASIAAIQMIGASFATYLVVNHERHQSYAVFDARLREQAAILRSLIEAPEDGGSTFIFHREFMALPKDNRYAIMDSSGRSIDGSMGWLGLKPVRDQRGIADVKVDGVIYRAFILQKLSIVDSESDAVSAPVTIDLVYAAPIAPVEVQIRRVEMQSIIACFALLSVSTLVTASALSYGLRPLRHLASSAEGIDIGRWTVANLNQSTEFSELKPLADALTNLVDRLHAAFDRERQFFADAAHEMKSSIAIVRSTLQFALQSERTATDYRVELREALKDTDRLQELVGSMFDLARIEAHESSYAIETGAAIHAQLQRVIDRFLPLATKKGVSIHVRAAESEVWVCMPEEDLFTVLSNLVENAISYTDDKGLIAIGVAFGGGSCHLSVEDQGCGIAPSALPYIYDRFYRVDDSRTRSTGGVGLGLSIVRALILRAGGTISVQSELGQGSIFEVVLPLFQRSSN